MCGWRLDTGTHITLHEYWEDKSSGYSSNYGIIVATNIQMNDQLGSMPHA